MLLSRRGCPLAILFAVLACVTSAPAQNRPVMNQKNASNQDAPTVINAGGTFITNYCGTNDLTISAGSGLSISRFMEEFTSGGASNNPSYLTTFTGASSNYTGDSLTSHLDTMVFKNRTLQFDFAQPLTSAQRLLVFDTDFNEVVTIQAFTKVGNVYTPVSLLGWTHETFSGMETIAPNSKWATWNASLGRLTGSGLSAKEPINALTPDQSIDRIIITSTINSGIDEAVQFISVPEPACGLAILLLTMTTLKSRPSSRRRGTL